MKGQCKKCQRRVAKKREQGLKEKHSGEAALVFEKRCAACNQTKLSLEFHRDRSKREGLTSTCQRCAGLRASLFYKNNKLSENKRRYDYQLRKDYGITYQDKQNMLEKQEGRCGACRSNDPFDRTWHVDHDHATGRVRELLCRKCNLALGCADESIDRLRALICYIEKHSN